MTALNDVLCARTGRTKNAEVLILIVETQLMVHIGEISQPEVTPLASQHLTKSRYIAGLQCPRRVWLLVHEPLPYEEPAPGVAETVRLDQVKTHYYGSHRKINPTGIVPKGPAIDLLAPTKRRIV
jgi:hypothetical protein